MEAIITVFGINRDRAEGGAGGALASPLFCKNKNKLKNNLTKVTEWKIAKNRKWPELLAKTNAQINRQNEALVVTIVKYFFASNLAEVNVF